MPEAKEKPSAKAWGCCLGVVLIPAALLTWFLVAAGNSSDNGTSPPIPAPTVPTAPPIAPGTAANLAPLTLGPFPDTADGEIAKRICEQWQGLRQEYVYRLTIDNSYQMNGWFSSSAWSKVQNDGMALGDDPAYSNLETALGVAITGEMASTANAAAVDKACAAAD